MPVFLSPCEQNSAGAGGLGVFHFFVARHLRQEKGSLDHDKFQQPQPVTVFLGGLVEFSGRPPPVRVRGEEEYLSLTLAYGYMRFFFPYFAEAAVVCYRHFDLDSPSLLKGMEQARHGH